MSIVKYENVEILRKEHVVLKSVNLTIEPGQFTYIIGKVGSGKSSLLKSMYAEIPIESGEAKVLEYDLTTLKRKQIPMLRREIGIVFQDFQLLTDRTVYDQQRIVIARALLNKPKLILADEPTGNLDPATGEQIVRYLHDIAKEGTAVIMATHNFAWLEQFPGRLLRCSDKHIVEESNNEEKLECE